MKFTLGWLKEHLETKASLSDICDTLSRIGLEVEAVHDPAAKLGAFTVARVLEAEPHPNADKLRVCKVDTGRGVAQVVCGATNARAGLIGVFAAPGVYVPGSDFTLGQAKIRGVESAGMLCSERELELSGEHDGIIELPESAGARVGERFVDVMGLNDPVIEIAITPNRPDALGVRGVARDLAAAGLGKLKKEDAGYTAAGKFKSPVKIALDFKEEARSACPVFAGRVVRGLKNGPSPAWLQQRLKAVGLRPINALVDVTNYIMYDRCRPLHVYDAAKLKGPIAARLGRDGESLAALDGRVYKIDDAMCVIADANGALGLGGIMGGEASGCTEATTDVFIEAAYFDPLRTAQTGRKTGINSDARYRFERGVDPRSAETGVALATKMILEICGGEPSKLEVAGAPPPPREPIHFDARRVEKLTGAKIKPADAAGYLKKLGCDVEGEGAKLRVAPPSWRPDIHGVADLVEEIVRLYGIDHVPPAPLKPLDAAAAPGLTAPQKRLRAVRLTLAARGLVEAIGWSFISKADAEAFGGGDPAVELSNPISREMSVMRPSLLPGLLRAAAANLNRGVGEAALFEAGQIFSGDAPDDQRNAAAGLRIGLARPGHLGRHWDGAGAAGYIDAKADAAAALAACGFDPAKAAVTRDAPAWLHPGRSGALKLGPKTVLAVFGEIHPAVAKAFGLDGAVAAFEVYLDAIPEPKKKSSAKPPLPAYDLQPVRRDFAFVLDAEAPAGDVLRAAVSADKALIADAVIFDVFEGGSLGPGKKSVALEVTLQPREKTLTDQEIEAVSAKIVRDVRAATGAEIRT
ncbi:MAG: phenylalanine--tRNA ligase subunit beta [Hyphomicrobiales bacterium]|nr:phenylalanine--tRNA ligase subunit beta [Hyphomicrobiales bacterium]